MTKYYNIHEVSHIAINYAIWVRHLIEGMPMYEKITPEMELNIHTLGSDKIKKIKPYEWLHSNYDNWFIGLSHKWREIANRDKIPKNEFIFSHEDIKELTLGYAVEPMNVNFDCWYLSLNRIWEKK